LRPWGPPQTPQKLYDEGQLMKVISNPFATAEMKSTATKLLIDQRKQMTEGTYQTFIDDAGNIFSRSGAGQMSLVKSAPKDESKPASVQEYEYGQQHPDFARRPQWAETGRDALGNPIHGWVFPPNPGQPQQQQGPGQQPGIGQDGEPLSGDDFLSTLPAGAAATVKGIAEGRINPTGRGMQKYIPLAAQYEPGLDMSQIQSRFKTRQEFTTGGPGSPAGMITAGNTAIDHLDKANAYAKQLTDSGFDWANWAINKAAPGSSKQAAALSGYKAGVTDRNAIKEALSQNLAGPERESAMAAQAVSLESKITALQDRWRQGMGPNTPDFELIHADMLPALNRLKGNLPYPNTMPPGMERFAPGYQAPAPQAQPSGQIRTYNPATGRLE
jgi:hypothetical protein